MKQTKHLSIYPLTASGHSFIHITLTATIPMLCSRIEPKGRTLHLTYTEYIHSVRNPFSSR